jgi:hypothetical protein
MSKRYADPVEVVSSAQAPTVFRWRGGAYHVRSVLGHWREDAGCWQGLAVPQRDLWRVEAANGGVYELACDPAGWRLVRVWD